MSVSKCSAFEIWWSVLPCTVGPPDHSREIMFAAALEINVVINVLLNRGWRGTAIDLKQTHVDWPGM